MKSFQVGNYEDDAKEYRGWFIGTFINDGPRKTEDVEIKYWKFPDGKTDHPEKTSATLECTIVLTGKIIGTVDNEPIELSGGSYIVIQPNTPNNLVERSVGESRSFTIKAPSDPTAKKVIK